MKTIWVFGDAGIDLYHVGTARGVSAEAPVPVMKIDQVLTLPGMAANVTYLLKSLPEIEAFLHFPSTPHIPVKNRLITKDGTQLARWDVEDWCTPLNQEDWLKVLSLPLPDAIIVSDYGKGTIDELAVKSIRHLAEKEVPLFIDTKDNPLVWTGLAQVTLFPNEKEYTQWKDQYDWLPQVVHKMSSRGARIINYGTHVFQTESLVHSVRNVSGAGDAVIAAYTAASIHGSSVRDALRASQIFAAHLVETPLMHTSTEATCN